MENLITSFLSCAFGVRGPPPPLDSNWRPRIDVLRTACSFRKKINSSLQKSNPRSRDAPAP
ncbi:hypothetical protein J6590_071682 [Homalodisca vitripennis]|nr:hypothetical protein J6590_071682 [Homalodisca vitripennis]